MASSKPTIVLIPSSFCPSALLWDKTMNLLYNGGYDAIAVELQSVSPRSTAPAKTMADDAAHIHGVVEALANEGKDVVLVMHAYGAIPGTQSIEGLTKKERSQDSKDGGVVGLVYIAGFLLGQGQSLSDNLSELPPFFKPSGEYLQLDPVGGAAVIFAELPKEQGEAWARKFPGQAMAAFGGRLTSASHYDVPVTYLKCMNDTVVPPAAQQKMVDDFKVVSRSSVEVVEVESGHVPMVVHVERTAEVILAAAGKV